MSRQLQLLAIGLNHHSAEIDIREQFAFPRETLAEAHQALHQLSGVSECVILTTCNRSELYLLQTTTEHDQHASVVLDWLHHWFGLQKRYDEHFYCYHDHSAAEHLLHVCAGLDSLVLGEPQISGQVKQALTVAQQVSAEPRIVGTILSRLFDTAFACNKAIRAETELGQHPVTIPFASISLAKQIFDDLRKAHILLVGAGEMIELCAQHFATQPVASITIANRSGARADMLVKNLKKNHSGLAIQHINLTQITERLANADIIITSTASQQALLTKAMMKVGLKQRRHRPVLAIDIAVPRNIEPQVNDLNDVYLYSIDDLTTVLESNRQQRAAAAQQARSIVNQHIQGFTEWLALYKASGQLQRFRQQALVQQQQLLAQAQRGLENGQPLDQILQTFAQRFTQRTVHGLTQAIRQAAIDGNHDLLHALQALFEPSTMDTETSRTTESTEHVKHSTTSNDS